jgi:hypothetical protein
MGILGWCFLANSTTLLLLQIPSVYHMIFSGAKSFGIAVIAEIRILHITYRYHSYLGKANFASQLEKSVLRNSVR